MKHKTVHLDAFIENPDNPQTVTDADFEKLIKSLRDMPQTLAANKIAFTTDYVALDGTDYTGQRVVIAGNKRLRALKQIAATGGLEIGYISAEGFVPDEWFFDLTPLGPEARNRWLVKSNVMSGEWDAKKLLELFDQEELAELVSDDTLDKLLADLSDDTPAEGKTDADAIPEAPTAPVSKRGEVYLLGEHRLMCGDSASAEDAATLMGGGLLIWFSPIRPTASPSATKTPSSTRSTEATR